MHPGDTRGETSKKKAASRPEETETTAGGPWGVSFQVRSSNGAPHPVEVVESRGN